MATLLVLTNLPDAQSARILARLLIEQRWAACANILAPCQSVYRWREEIEETSEVPLLIKTTAQCYGGLEAAIRTHHPYELPEIIAVSVERGLPEYLAWVAAETSFSPKSDPTC